MFDMILENLNGRDVILASSSPRRKELLGLLGIDFRIVKPDCEEPVWQTGENALDYVLSAARCKTEYVANKYPQSVVLGADTSVICDGQVFGKPADDRDARRMLCALQGRTHQVATAVCVAAEGKLTCQVVVSDVTFGPMTDAEISAYLATNEAFDKAGAYGIQGVAACWITGMQGDWSNVVGLPVPTVYAMLKGL